MVHLYAIQDMGRKKHTIIQLHSVVRTRPTMNKAVLQTWFIAYADEYPWVTFGDFVTFYDQIFGILKSI